MFPELLLKSGVSKRITHSSKYMYIGMRVFYKIQRRIYVAYLRFLVYNPYNHFKLISLLTH